MSSPSRQSVVALAAGLVVVASALAMPEPSRPAPTSNAGAATLEDVWPSARTTTIPATLTDGATYLPLVVVDPSTSVGLATTLSPDGGFTNRLVMHRTDQPDRLIRSYEGAAAPWVIAHAVTAEHLYWLESGTGRDEKVLATLWRTGLTDGPATRLAEDRAEARYGESASDLIIADGHVRWMASTSQGSALRSVPLSGGALTSRELPGVYTLTAWPWATSTGTGDPGPATLLNMNTGETRTVAAGPDDVLDCTLTWCRVSTAVDDGRRVAYSIKRPDGSDRQQLGNDSVAPLNGDVALLDRFEVLGSTTGGSASFVQAVWLHDLETARRVKLTDIASGGVRSHHDTLWWPTGDNEAMVWHLLDLGQLT